MDNKLSTILQTAYQQLVGLSETPQLDAQVLIAHILNKPRSWVISHTEVELRPDTINTFHQAIKRLISGEPLPYIIGTWEFYALQFKIDRNVLIPRPETELIIDESIKWADLQTKNIKAVDIGTGSGCIAISISVHAKNVLFEAYDINLEALKIARHNAETHHVDHRITFHKKDIRQGFTNTAYDLIVTNPPYIPTDVLRDLKVYKREPSIALDGGEDGLDYIRSILEYSSNVLNPGGLFLCEIESQQGAIALELARIHFADAEISIIKDYAEHDRLLKISNSAN